MRYINDLMDVIQPAAEQTATAQLYTHRPISPSDGGITFNFSYVDPHSKTYSRLMGTNLQNVEGQIAIRTRQRLKFVPGESIIVMPDMNWYVVSQETVDYNSVPQQVLRLWGGAPVGAARLLRLTQIESDWGTNDNS